MGREGEDYFTSTPYKERLVMGREGIKIRAPLL
jgi:hypothetical protein